jgi:putative endonuclease
MTNVEKGKQAEDLAVSFLKRKGYQIVSRNYRHQRGEIDIIANYFGTYVFVEVKSRSSTDFGMPEDSVHTRKETLVRQTAEHYLIWHDIRSPIRFDVVSIVWLDAENTEISHFEDAF